MTTQSAGASPVTDSTTYTAPATPPSPNTVTVTVTSQADPSKKAQATLAIQPGVSVNVSPATATLAANHRLTLSAQLNGTTNAGVTWSVSGIAGGNIAFGQICVVASNPCQAVTNSTSQQVDYLAPGAIPSPNPVSAAAVSAADPTKSASAQITLMQQLFHGCDSKSSRIKRQPWRGSGASARKAAGRAEKSGRKRDLKLWK